MKLNVLISTSRKTTAKLNVKDHLLSKGYAIGQVLESDDFPKTAGEDSTQIKINLETIPQMDWFILLAPLDHVGSKTFSELKAACDSYLATGKPTISIFHSSNPIHIEKKEGDVDFQDMLGYLEDKMRSKWKREQTEQLVQDSEQYYNDFSDTNDLLARVSHEFDLLCSKSLFMSMQLPGLSIKGKDLKAMDLYYDKVRADSIYGFDENRYFRRRSVDYRIEKALDPDNGYFAKKIVIITGSPGSGKTRAVYEYVTRSMGDKNIIVAKRENIHEIYRRLVMYHGQFYNEYTAGRQFFIICDQIKDVLSKLGGQETDRFFEILRKNPDIFFIATSISSSFESFKSGFDYETADILGDSTVTEEIRIPRISDDDDAEEIREWLENEYGIQHTATFETVGDYIPGLRKYIEDIVEKIHSQYRKGTFGKYIQWFIQSVQLHSMFRKTSPDPLFIPLMLMQTMNKCSNNDSNDIFEKNCKRALRYLISINFLTLWHNDCPINVNSLRRFNYFSKFEYDGEKFISLIPPEYTYSINELVYEGIRKYDREISVKSTDSENTDCLTIVTEDYVNLLNAIDTYYMTYPDAETFRRIIPRIPAHECTSEGVQEALGYIHGKMREFLGRYPEKVREPAIVLAYSMLIGRAADSDTINGLLDEMKDLSIVPDSNTIGEIYRFAVFHQDSERERAMLLASDIQTKSGIDDTIYTHLRRLECTTGTFGEAAEYINGRKVLDDIRQYSTEPQSLEYANSKAVFHLLCKRIKSIADCRTLLKMYLLAGMPVEPYELILMIRAGFHESGYLNEFHSLTTDPGSPYSSLLADCHRELAIAFLISNSPDLDTSYSFYLKSLERTGKDNPKLFAMCLRNASRHDFQTVLKYEREMSLRIAENTPSIQISPILYNLMISIAPTIDDAMPIIGRLSKIDDFTLNNLLSYCANSKDEKKFIFAYQIINRPEFKAFRDGIHAIGNLYKTATAKEHETYIENMLKSDLPDENRYRYIHETVESSLEIMNIKLRKTYRSVDEAYELLREYHEKFKGSFRIKADLYGAFMRKLYTYGIDEKEYGIYKKKYEKLINEYPDNSRLVLDEHYYSCLYRSFRKDDIVRNGTVTQDFKSDMEGSGARDRKTFLNILNFLKTEKYDRKDIDAVYEYYLDWYERSGKPATLAPNKDIVQIVQDQENTGGTTGSTKGEVKAKTPEEILKMIEQRYINVYGSLTATTLNNALKGIAQLKDAGNVRYSLCNDFIKKHRLEDILTDKSFVFLTKMTSGKDEFSELLGLIEEMFVNKGYISEILFGTIAGCDHARKTDIAINRKYYEKWISIYKELDWEFRLDNNWNTLYRYLTVEVRNLAFSGDRSSIPVILHIKKLMEEHGKPFSIKLYGKKKILVENLLSENRTD